MGMGDPHEHHEARFAGHRTGGPHETTPRVKLRARLHVQPPRRFRMLAVTFPGLADTVACRSSTRSVTPSRSTQ